MRLLSREGMRDMRDGPPPRNHPGRAAVFGATPPIQEGRQMGTENDQRSQKKNAYFFLTC